MSLLYEELSYRIRGMFFKIYNELGPGFKESVYVGALLKLLGDDNIPYKREKQFSINFNDTKVGATKIDLVIDNKIIIEVKATEINNSLFEKQILSYLKSTGIKLGFLVNFGTNKLYIRRYINSKRQCEFT